MGLIDTGKDPRGLIEQHGAQHRCTVPHAVHALLIACFAWPSLAR
jgi:hypothetical protein